MRTAKEIIEKAVRDYFANANKWLLMNSGVISQIEKEINEARTEAIEECSQVAYSIGESDVGESILNLIKELK